MPTATTVPLIILVVLLWRYTRGQTLAIVLFCSIFDAASAINIAGIGVSPWLFALVLCMGLDLVKGHGRFQFTPGLNKAALHLLLLFVGYTLWSGMVYPILFRGVPVMHTGPVESLSWTIQNMKQILYLLAALTVFLIAVSRPRAELRSAMEWYVRGCVVASFFAMYQLAHAILHIPYPDAILYSSPTHVIYHAYMINGMWRLNSTFTEASAMATFLTVGLGLIGWDMATLPVSLSRTGAFLLVLVSTLLTLSSLGYSCLFYMMFVGSIMYLRYLWHRGGMSPVKIAGACALLLVAIGLATFTNTPQVITKVVTSTLLDKRSSDSFKERQGLNDAAMKASEMTYYIGAGWGSLRASGLIYILMGTVGILGVFLFLAFLCSLGLPLLRRSKVTDGANRDFMYEKSLFALSIMLIGLTIAGAEPVEPVLWILFGVATVGNPPPFAAARAAALQSRQNLLSRQYA